jgi:tetratricopeptide (TPR) repeat protein
MKGSERHHLKDNELVNLAARVRHTVNARKQVAVGIVVAIAVTAGATLGYLGWRSRLERRAEELMAAAMAVDEIPVRPTQGADPATPPAGPSFASERERLEAAVTKFKTVADRYSSTETGLRARYREAAIWSALGKPAEAAAAYQQVVDGADSALIAQMARLGVAEAHVQAGEYDRAIKIYQDAAARTDGPVPVEGILMQLGRAYLSAGKTEDAQETFNRVVEEFPNSPLRSEASRELEMLDQS